MRPRNYNPTPKDLQRTPPALFRALDKIYNFEVDAAALKHNSLCEYYFSDQIPDPQEKCLGNALCMEGWPIKPIWMNPPYSRQLVAAFVRKAYFESLKGVTVVALIQCDMSTNWWDYCMNAAEWIRIKGRVQFLNNDGSLTDNTSPFANIAVEFNAKKRKENKGKIQISELKNWK